MTSIHEDLAKRYPGAVILPYDDHWPTIAESAFIAPTAVVIGNVTIGDEASIWYHTTVRGDIAPIFIGDRSNVQDNAVVHVNKDAPVAIGADVTIGHTAIVHGTTIEDGALVGMGAIVMSYTHLGRQCIIAAGALVPERTVVEACSVMVGVPARPRNVLDDAARDHLAGIAGRYQMVAAKHRESLQGSRLE